MRGKRMKMTGNGMVEEKKTSVFTKDYFRKATLVRNLVFLTKKMESMKKFLWKIKKSANPVRVLEEIH